MNRRSFIKQTGVMASMLPLVSALESCHTDSGGRQRILILVQLIGGNDGLNTLIPLDAYARLVKARPNLYIPENKILAMKGTHTTGLHPSLAALRDMYDHDLITFVQGAGYENQNYSHFRSADIYLTGSDASQVLYTGWMARSLQTRYPHYPEGFPSQKSPDPPAIKVGDNGTFVFQGDAMDMSIVINPATGFEPTQTDEGSETADTYAAQEVRSIREILQQTERYSGVIRKALSGKMQHSAMYPPKGENPLADQLRMVAELIKGGLQTSVYHVDLKAFDTHSEQVEAGDTTKGVHARLLHQVSQALACFWDDMEQINRDKDVCGMVFSEFGRRIISNAAHGTDHGSSQPIIFFGRGLNAGIIGHNPEIPDQPASTDNLKMQVDFRSVYATVLQQWMQMDPARVQGIFSKDLPQLDIFRHGLFS